MHGIIQSRSAWRGPQLASERDWIHEFTEPEIQEVDDALAAAKSGGGRSIASRSRTFRYRRWPSASRLRGSFWKTARASINCAALGSRGARRTICGYSIGDWVCHLGTAVSQSKDGDILGDVRNVGVDIHSPQGRGYKSNQRLNFHTDSADVVGLFVLRTAMQGGQSKVVSSVSAHNEIARLRPDLLEVLYRPFYWSWNQQEPAGAPPYYQQPIFTLHEGKFSCRYIRGHINNAQRFPEVPRLTAEQIAALDLLDQVTNDESLHVAYDFRPGDVQLLNNHICLHARSAFEDYPEHDRRRHLLRMWLSVPNSRALSPALGTIYQDQRSGAVRGGFPSRTGRIIYESTGELVD